MRLLYDNTVKLALGTLICAVGYTRPASAQEAAQPDTATAEAPTETAKEDEPEQIVIVGSRRVMRSVLDSPTPVDSIQASDFQNQGSTDMDGLLRTLVPSYNVSPQPISDAATLIRPANLRGLPPDSTVVLINGKRRHRGSVITFLGSGLSDGSQGVDLGPIPSIALKRVDVLRDGAAAQYGSDAIAGVMNFVLRDDPDGASVITKVGSTYEGDGTAWSIAANVGLPLTEQGFFNFSIEYGNADATSRSVQRSDAAFLASQDVPVANPAQVWGSPEVSDDLKLFANMGLDIAEGVKFYAFGNVARRDVLGGFFFRNPATRGGVFSATDGQELLVGDAVQADPTRQGTANCPAAPNINFGTEDDPIWVPDPAVVETFRNNPDCFVFNELFAGGFTPQFGGRVTDFSIAGGFRGITDFGLTWDLSAVVGSNEVDFVIQNTVNATLGPLTPTKFRPGTYRETDQTFNLDLTYPIDIGVDSPLTVAAGAEYRKETFTIVAGDLESFTAGPYTDQGFSIGSNGFPGFSPDIAGDFDRENIAAYLDLTVDPVEGWTTQLAGRVESFDTFGTQGVIKAATRIGIGQIIGMDYGYDVAIRGAVGTGFRAPSAGQANVSNISTVAGPDGILENRGTIPPTNPIAAAAGGRELEPETSLNVTGGVIFALGEYLSLTVDYYNIQVRDRISQSADVSLTPAQAAQLEEQGIAGGSDLSTFRFFTNAFDTKTQGIDVVATSSFDFGEAGVSSFSLAYTWNETEVGDFDAAFDSEGNEIFDDDGNQVFIINDQRISEIEDSLPKHRVILTGNHMVGPFRVMLRGSYYDSWLNPANVGDFRFDGRFLVDMEVAYTFFDNHFTLVAGAQNIFNTFPEENPEDFQTVLGSVYPENSAIGLNGGFWYFRLQAQL